MKGSCHCSQAMTMLMLIGKDTPGYGTIEAETG